MFNTTPMRFFMSLFALLSFGPFATAQNVGIGTSTPFTPLDVRSASIAHLFRLDGGNGTYMSINENGSYRGYMGSYAGNAEDIDIGTGAGNTTGKLHLTIQGAPQLTVASNGNVGIGNTNPAWKLDVNGGMQLLGSLVVSGSSGTAGQVLTSNGTAAPSWTTLGSTMSNDVRFEAVLSGSSATDPFVSMNYTTAYNLNTTAVTINASNITVNRSGLYHIEGYYQVQAFFSSLPIVFLQGLAVNIDGRAYQEVPDSEPVQRDLGGAAVYNSVHRFVHEVYITAPGTITFSNGGRVTYGGASLTGVNRTGRISGYLIAD